ncbi:MAG: hypothetical protein ACLRPX_07755 [Ruthenibacterium sp.]
MGLWLVLAGALAVFCSAWGLVSALLLAHGRPPCTAALCRAWRLPNCMWAGTMFQRAGACFFPLCAGSHAALSGCHILETPLCRLTGVCVLMFSSSGAFLILPGFESKDAQHVARLLALGEGQP